MQNNEALSLAAFALVLVGLGLFALSRGHIGVGVGALGAAGYFAWRWWQMRRAG